MSVVAAKKFIKDCMSDKSVRDVLLTAECPCDGYSVLADRGYTFSEEEFEEAFSYLLANSPSQEKTDELKDFKKFIEYLDKV